VLSVLPVSLMYTVPWGFLSAVLLVFGKLSSHHEITSFRVAGVSLVRLAAPVFVIGALLSLGSLWLNSNIIPKSKASSVELLYEQASRDPDSLLKPGVVQGNFKGRGSDVQKVLIEGKSGEWVEGFHFYQIPDSDTADRGYVHAARAALAVDERKRQLRVKLENAYFETHKPDGKVEVVFAEFAEPLLIDLKDPKSRRVRASTMTNREIEATIAASPDLKPSKVLDLRLEITKRRAFSMACLAFAFIAVPLGLNSRRKDTSGGLIISLLIGTGYFLLTVLAEEFDSPVGATAMLWAPNVGCVLLGLFLFRRARFK
jgi:lipopolysaccharide export LptBFGC system permease protein LptF